MKRIFCFCLAVLWLVPVFAFAYESVDFVERQSFGGFSFQTPENWIIQPDAKNPACTRFFDEDSKAKEHGMIETLWKEAAEPLFETVDEANKLLEARLKKEKIKDFQLTTVAGYPAACWTNTQTLATVKKTFVHGIYLMAPEGSLDILFSTRSGDKELQAAEFEKLLGTVAAVEKLAVPQSVPPKVRELLDGGLTFQEIKPALETGLGNPMGYVGYTNKNTQVKTDMLTTNGKKSTFLGMEYTYQYYLYEDQGRPVEYFQTFMEKEAEWPLAQGVERVGSISERMKLDFGDVVRVKGERRDDVQKKLVEVFQADRELSFEEILALLETSEEGGLWVTVYYGEGKEWLTFWTDSTLGKKAKNGEVRYPFDVEITLSAVPFVSVPE